MQILTLSIAILLFLLFIISVFVSILEHEKKAARNLLLLSVFLPLPYLLVALLNFTFQQEAIVVLLTLSLLGVMIFLLPIGRNPGKYTFPSPTGRIDERDTMFSRNELKPGSENFTSYYQKNQDKKETDDSWRKDAGLLKPGSSQYNPFHFAAADASFETIEALKHEVDGPIHDDQQPTEYTEITRFIKGWARKLGVLETGITELKEYHMYTVGGRAERYGKVYDRQHDFAIAITVEMAKEMVAAAPSGSIVMESGQQYLESGKIAIQIAKFIRNLGYEARAHIDGNYEVICPMVARDAGLGEIGRMGLLMTPKLGPRVRIAVVTTNLPLVTDKALNDGSMIDFCTICKKCAESCPSKAISFSDQEMIGDVKRWKINQEACFGLWCKLGTDCGRCVSVCPYAHPDNLMHNAIRMGIRNSSIFRRLALKLDDFIYGRKPEPAKFSRWMDIKARN